jgi:hypothetical protein
LCLLSRFVCFTSLIYFTFFFSSPSLHIDLIQAFLFNKRIVDTALFLHFSFLLLNYFLHYNKNELYKM